MATTPKRVTIRDVALAAGVSRAAVSKVLNNGYGVSDDMRERVEQAIEQLGYRPLVNARGMRGASYTMGIALPASRSDFFPDIIEGAMDELDAAGYQVIVARRSRDRRGEDHAFDALNDRRVDGIITVAPLLGQAAIERVARHTPTVVLGRHDHSTVYDAVVGDDIAGAGLVVDHLVELGHRRIVHLAHRETDGGKQIAGTPHAVRAEGYRQAMQRHGLDAHISILSSDYTENTGYDAALGLFSRGQRPTAIFAGADEAAFGVLRAAHDAGIDVPSQLSVAGYDDSRFANHPRFSLTSVDQFGRLMGSRAARLLLERIAGRTQSQYISTSPRLAPRGSTGQPPRQDAGTAAAHGSSPLPPSDEP